MARNERLCALRDTVMLLATDGDPFAVAVSHVLQEAVEDAERLRARLLDHEQRLGALEAKLP